MQPTTTHTPMTAEAFLDWVHRPENQGRHYELERGEVVEMSRPGERHGVICANVAYLLGGYVRQRRRGRVLTNDPGLLIARDPDTVRGPDLMYYADSRAYDQLNPKYAEGTPALVVEVLSPTDRVGRVLRRVGEYLRAGVGLVWIIDPETRDVTVHRPGVEPDLVEGDGTLAGGETVPGLSVALADVFFVAEGA